MVLSNNDGCVIARSAEAKALGIRMGVPAFQIENEIKKHKIAVFSSNYTLYGDMSSRVMAVLQSFVPEMEIYSIDEAFLDLSGLEHLGLKEYGEKITKTVYRSTGMPVSIGIAPTKTLSKLANRFAKKYPKYNNVCIIDSDYKRRKALQLTEVGDIWGIGRQQRKMLNKNNIFTAYDFTQMPQSWVRKNMTVVGERIWQELKGVPSIELELAASNKKQICTSRSFGMMVTEYAELEEAVATYAGLCASKLRKQKSCAVSLMVFIHTNNFREDLLQYYKNCVINLPVPSNSTPEIVHYALIALRNIFKDGYLYKKAGVIITEIIPKSAVQLNLFDKVDRDKHDKLMQVMDNLNSGFNRNLIRLAVQGTDRKWKLKQESLSPCYTTKLKDVIRIKI